MFIVKEFKHLIVDCAGIYVPYLYRLLVYSVVLLKELMLLSEWLPEGIF